MLCVLIVIGAVWATRTEVERRSPLDPVQRLADHVSLRPVLLDVDGDAFVLDGLLDIDERTPGVPATLVLRVPESAQLVSMTCDLLDRWTEDGNDVGVDLSKADRPRPSVALSKGDSLVRLSLVRMSPPLELRRDVTLARWIEWGTSRVSS